MGHETIIRLAQASAERADQLSTSAAVDPTASLASFEQWFVARAQSDPPLASVACSQDIQPESSVGEALGRFQVIRRLGSGGFGIVLLAFDPLLHREIALKLPRPELLVVPDWADRVLHEARIAATLDHPGIVPVHEVGTIGPVWYIASAYCDGRSLAAFTAQQAELMPIRAATELIALVADALQHAHARGVLHRDLKTANILLTKSPGGLQLQVNSASRWSPRLTDFGLAARQVDLESASVPRVAGTPAYMPPELAAGAGGVHSIASDVYSLGAVLFELLTGRPPFVAATSAATLELVKQGAAPAVRSIRPAVPADLDAIVGKCLHRHPHERYESAAGLASDLRGYLAGRPVAARPLGSTAHVVRWCRNRPVLAALAAMLLISGIVGAGGITWQWRRAEQHLATAQAERKKAEQRSALTERALLDLSSAREDGEFWRDHTHTVRYPQFVSATSPFQSLLFDPQERGDSLPLLAMSHDQIAMHHEVLSEFSMAKNHYRESIAQWYAIVRDAPDDQLYRRRFNQACLAYGRFLRIREKLTNGVVYIHDGRLLEIVPLNDALGFELSSDYLQFLFDHGLNLAKAKGWEGAASVFAATRDLSRALLIQKPRDTNVAQVLAGSAIMLGKTTRSAGNRSAGLDLLQQARLETARLVDLHPYDLAIASHLAESCAALATKDFRGTESERIDLLREGIHALDHAIQHAPENARSADLRVAANLYHQVAVSLRSVEPDQPDLRDAIRRACEYSDRLLARSDSTPSDAGAAAIHYYEAAKFYAQAESGSEMFQFATKAIQAFAVQESGKESVKRPRLTKLEAQAECYSLQAMYLQRTQQPAEAAAALRNGIALIDKWSPQVSGTLALVRLKEQFRKQLADIASDTAVAMP